MKDLTLKDEQLYLNRVNKHISKELGIRNEQLVGDTENIDEIQEDMWEDLGAFGASRDPIEFAQYLEMWRRQALLKDITSRRANTLVSMLNNAFFGRIDFSRDKDNKQLPVYVGLSTIRDEWEFLVYDWRAPICSLFYEGEIGPSEYTAPGGVVKGELKRRIQYNIEAGVIKGFFDTALKVDDEILQDILSKSTDGQIKNIVQSIQKQQNAAIRDDKNKFLAVFGPAGCGKTTVAMHRAAWLLYNSRDNLNANDIVFVSPNLLFTDYLSNILPELGEDNIEFTTIYQLERQHLSRFHIEKRHTHTEYLLKNSNTNAVKRLKQRMAIKNSYPFYSSLKHYLDRYMDNFHNSILDVVLAGEVLCTKEELVDMVNTSKGVMPFKSRINKAKSLCYDRFDAKRKQYKSEKQEIYENTEQWHSNEDIKSMINEDMISLEKELNRQLNRSLSPDITKVYYGFLKEYDSRIDLQTPFRNNINAHRIGQEDAAALLFSQIYISDAKDANIKHLLLDESQDYNYLYISAFKLLYPKASITMLGDFNQAIYTSQSMQELDGVSKRLFDGQLATVNLTTSYRSSFEITKLCNRIAKSKNKILPYDRSVKEPEIAKLENKQAIYSGIKNIVDKLSNNYNSIGIIARTMSTCSGLKNVLGYNVLSTSSDIFPKGICILPSYISKGLEFDCVIVVSTTDDHFDGEDDRNLFYTICSRALHELYILTNDDIKLLD